MTRTVYVGEIRWSMTVGKMAHSKRSDTIQFRHRAKLGGRGRGPRLRAEKATLWDFPDGSVVKSLPANAGDTGSIPDLGRSHMPCST